MTWLLSVLIVALVTGGVAAAVADHRSDRVTETVIHEHVVLPEGQAEVTGTLTSFVADGANGPALGLPIELPTGGATIEGVAIDGRRSTVVWDGGRPFRLSGTGAMNLGPTHVELRENAVSWSLDGVRVLAPGDYRLDTPVAVGHGGLAQPADAVSFVADASTTIALRGGATARRGVAPLHLSGPGSLRADGSFTITTHDGVATRSHFEFGPGSFVFDLRPDKTFTATFNGPLASR